MWSPTQGNRDLHARSGLKLHSGRPSPQAARVAARPGGLGKTPQSVRGLQTPNRPPALTELGPRTFGESDHLCLRADSAPRSLCSGHLLPVGSRVACVGEQRTPLIPQPLHSRLQRHPSFRLGSGQNTLQIFFVDSELISSLHVVLLQSKK